MLSVSGPRTRIRVALAAGAAILWTSLALAHAMPQDMQPGVGAVLNVAPHRVRIRFDARLEEAFSTIEVRDDDGNTVSGKTTVDPDSPQTLEVAIREMIAGDYHVYWDVISVDGHRTSGDYVFHFRPQ